MSGGNDKEAIIKRLYPWWTKAFNGQEGRSRLFLRMIEALHPAALVETGTFRGTTTAFMADHFDGPIFTCEVDQRSYFTAKAALARFRQIDLRNQDSRDFLRALFIEEIGDPAFFYLDAHWRNDLPLCAELELILSRGRPAAIMIDDFAVPTDPEYQFDDYGPGKALTLELLAKVDSRGSALFFPTLPAREETGAQRGCAVIGVGDVASVLDTLRELQRCDWPIGSRRR